jgi:ribosome-binding protein aMBF1 (putative translation factor)
MPTHHESTGLLHDLIAERTTVDRAPAPTTEGEHTERQILRDIAAARRAAHLSRTIVAARMNTSEASVARLESAAVDTKMSTLERFAAAVGKRIHWELVDAAE